MNLKDKILVDLEDIDNPDVLNQLFDFIQILKKNTPQNLESNKSNVWKFVGCLSDQDAEELKSNLKNSYNPVGF